MGLAFKFLHSEGRASKGGDMIWPLPKGCVPGEFISTRYRTGEYYFCSENQLYLWVDLCLYVGQFKYFLSKDESSIVVDDAQLISKVTSWNENSQEIFMDKCYNFVNNNLRGLQYDKELFSKFEEGVKHKHLLPVCKFSMQLSELFTIDNCWQNNYILEIIHDEILEIATRVNDEFL